MAQEFFDSEDKDEPNPLDEARLMRVEKNSVCINRFISHHMLDEPVRDKEGTVPYPKDAEDLLGVVVFLDKHADWRKRIGEMGKYSFRWKVLAENWDKLEMSCRTDQPEDISDVLQQTMNDAVDRLEAEKPDPGLALKVKGLVRDEASAQKINNLTLPQATRLANALTQRLEDESCKSYSVSVSTNYYTNSSGNKSWQSGVYINKLIPEDFPKGKSSFATVILRYNRTGMDMPELSPDGPQR